MSKRGKYNKLSTGCAIKGIVAVTSFFAAIMAGSSAIYQRNVKKMQQHEKQNNMMYHVTLGSREVKVGNRTDGAYLSCLLGGIQVILPDNPENFNLNLEVFNLFGKMIVYVPENMNVSYEGEEKLGKVTMTVLPIAETSEDERRIPTVHITGKTICSEIVICHRTS